MDSLSASVLTLGICPAAYSLFIGCLGKRQEEKQDWRPIKILMSERHWRLFPELVEDSLCHRYSSRWRNHQRTRSVPQLVTLFTASELLSLSLSLCLPPPPPPPPPSIWNDTWCNINVCLNRKVKHLGFASSYGQTICLPTTASGLKESSALHPIATNGSCDTKTTGSSHIRQFFHSSCWGEMVC